MLNTFRTEVVSRSRPTSRDRRGMAARRKVRGGRSAPCAGMTRGTRRHFCRRRQLAHCPELRVGMAASRMAQPPVCGGRIPGVRVAALRRSLERICRALYVNRFYPKTPLSLTSWARVFFDVNRWFSFYFVTCPLLPSSPVTWLQLTAIAGRRFGQLAGGASLLSEGVTFAFCLHLCLARRPVE